MKWIPQQFFFSSGNDKGTKIKEAKLKVPSDLIWLQAVPSTFWLQNYLDRHLLLKVDFER